MINSEAEYNQMLSDNNEYQYNNQREMKTPMQELMEYMEQNQYFIGNDLLAKYKELLEKEVADLLPTDEDIIKQGKAKYPYKKTSDGTYYEGKCKGYIEGAMWLKDKIKKL